MKKIILSFLDKTFDGPFVSSGEAWRGRWCISFGEVEFWVTADMSGFWSRPGTKAQEGDQVGEGINCELSKQMHGTWVNLGDSVTFDLIQCRERRWNPLAAIGDGGIGPCGVQEAKGRRA